MRGFLRGDNWGSLLPAVSARRGPDPDALFFGSARRVFRIGKSTAIQATASCLVSSEKYRGNRIPGRKIGHPVDGYAAPASGRSLFPETHAGSIWNPHGKEAETVPGYSHGLSCKKRSLPAIQQSPDSACGQGVQLPCPRGEGVTLRCFTCH